MFLSILIGLRKSKNKNRNPTTSNKMLLPILRRLRNIMTWPTEIIVHQWYLSCIFFVASFPFLCSSQMPAPWQQQQQHSCNMPYLQRKFMTVTTYWHPLMFSSFMCRLTFSTLLFNASLLFSALWQSSLNRLPSI